MRKYAIIVAGGSGTRMQSLTPKQFLLLNDKPVLYYTLKAFLDAFPDMRIILVLPPDYTDMGSEIIDAYFEYSRIQITAGGETRFHSVQNGLKQVEQEGIIFVHDGVRCLVSEDLLYRCYRQVVHMGSAVPVIPVKESLRVIEGEDNEAVDRSNYVIVQTPQVFHSKILLPAFEIDFKEKFTDEATVVEAYGLKINLVPGEETNIKITRREDLLLAEKILQDRVVQ
jgi:2-C-methyl-D-erythritol 4-phosphate cytidylyltransferase